jgi:SAM-dependent methyltransferase
MDISELNRQEYERKSAVDVYVPMGHLLPEEQVIFSKVAREMPNARVLEIGIGAGRTIAALKGLFASFVGIDYSHAMLEAARRAHPEADLRWADARDLAEFADASFDFVYFAMNGIDSLSHSDRLRVLSAAHRVLREGGLFGFSSHNLDWRDSHPMRVPPPAFSLRHPLHNLRELKRFVLELLNFRKLKHLETRGDGYAIINDRAHYYSLLLYHVTRKQQLAQLRDAGFTGEVSCFDRTGREIPQELDEDRNSIWIHYLVRKL